VAVVTGASRGLGRAVAVALAEAGADVVLASRDLGGLEETARLIGQATGREALTARTDVASISDVETLQAKTEARFGAANILVNAAGVFGPLALFSETDAADWIETVTVNAIGPYLTCRLFVPPMLRDGWGRIVNVSSAAALYPPTPFNSAYATSKVALNQLTRHLAAEVAGTGVTANVIHPGSLKTSMWADMRAKVAVLDGRAEAFRAWVENVERTGGDPLSKAVELVLELVHSRSDQTNGQFCWPRDALEEPVPSW
jgi:NAD(P)-dependent dehydrogenase (short-subunit alcohol dehydrogenase family)